MSLFRDKIAFITGAGSGLGCALSEDLGRNGAVSIVTDIDSERAAQVTDRITASGGRARALQLDVSDADSVTRAVDCVVREYGRLDYIFNNAGIIILSEVRDMTLEHWHRILKVNLLGVIHGTTAAYRHMVRQGFGHIVNVASLGGLVHLPTYAAYAMSKHAVVGLTNSLRPEAAKLGVKVSLVCPGTMNTGLGAAATIVRASREQLESHSKKRKPKQESVEPAAAARVILRGVERNQRVIVFPFSARLLWWLYRVQPALLGPLDSWFINTLRAARTES
ncbi:MAG: SDR family oxidoreductase [Acidobacteriia bacterium]|nr:SDR family oxidoreductase [Terriglobia bacterium]